METRGRGGPEEGEARGCGRLWSLPLGEEFSQAELFENTYSLAASPEESRGLGVLMLLPLAAFLFLFLNGRFIVFTQGSIQMEMNVNMLDI